MTGLDDTVALLHTDDDIDDGGGALLRDPRYRRAVAWLRDVEHRLDTLRRAGA